MKMMLQVISFFCISFPDLHAQLTNHSATHYTITTQELKSDLIPDSVFLMTGLTTLSVTGSDCDIKQYDKNGNVIKNCWMITTVPAAISNLRNLDTLRLTLGAFTRLPDGIAALQKLRVLDLTDSNISDISNLTSLKNLNQLLLFGCRLSKLPADIGRLSNLKYLGLTGNDLDVQEIKRIRKALPDCEIIFSK